MPGDRPQQARPTGQVSRPRTANHSSVRTALLRLLAAALAAVVGTSAAADERIGLVLNWVPTADHAPYYFARAQGWYRQAGLDVSIEIGKGSAVSAQRVGAGIAQFGIADLPTALVARGKGAAIAAVMVVYANSPQGFYWLRSSGINGAKDFPGRRIGNPPGDAARIMWPAFARRAGIDPDGVIWVNVSPQAKLASLKSRAIDITTDFYNEHDLKVREFGADLGFLPWRSTGLNPYGNSILVNTDFLAAHREAVRGFVQATQRAFAACVKDAEPCLKALVAEASGLDLANQRDQWQRVKELMRDPTTEAVALGAFNPQRLREDYDLIRAQFGMDKPFDVDKVVVNDFLDTGIRMPREAP